MLTAGTVIGNRFRIERPLGDGMSGETYAAWDEGEGCRVAVKIQEERQPQTTTSFLGQSETIVYEARIHEQLGGVTGIPRFYDRGQYRNRQYIAMQLIEGITLTKLIERTVPAGRETIVSVVAQLCEILDQLHERNFVHRDVKPHNIIVDRTGDLWLIDFGITTVACQDCEEPTGTRPYAAPEQYEWSWITEATDIYAVGVLLFEMATGSVPYQDCDGPPVEGTNPFPKGLPPFIPEELKTLGLSMVACDPQQRPATMIEVLNAVRPMLPTPESPRDPKAPNPDPAARFRRSRRAR